MTGAALQTIAKLTNALEGIRNYIGSKTPNNAAKLDLIYVIANETLNEVEPEIEKIKADAMEQYAVTTVSRP
jgi:hypothetical protein